MNLDFNCLKRFKDYSCAALFPLSWPRQIQYILSKETSHFGSQMESTNPFHEDASEEEEPIETVLTDKPPVPLPSLSVDSIAEYLLKKQFILTALEFHTEILESGKELARLKNYFSNPSHFEQITPKELSGSGSLYRTSSCSTFDSLDLTRYSDDGAQQVDDRVAVLEFELRKAKETISSLRTNLTDAVEKNSFLKSQDAAEDEDAVGDDECNGGDKQADEVKPMERRAVNYLINEYLLQNDYKLTSITLADENEDQDFEDWDDVGLNMAKPPNLLKLYRDYATLTAPNASAAAIEENHGNPFEIASESDLVQSLRDECETLREENTALASTISALQQEVNKKSQIPNAPLTSTPIKQMNGEDNHPGMDQVMSDIATVQHKDTQTDRKETCDKQVSSDEFTEDKEEALEIDEGNCFPLPQRMTREYWKELFMSSEITLEDSLTLEKVQSVSTSLKELVSVLTSSLPKIIPTILLQKRENLIPVILSTSAMNFDPNERNKLLHELFNLIKKPDKIQRQMILCGCVAYAKHVGPSQTEEDLLPQCWEQIDHKYTERRYIVAEACGALAAYMSPAMRGSLLLSILQQMQEDEKSPEVRQAIVRSISLVFSLLQDDDKYSKAFEILCKFLQDPSLPVRETTRQCLLPSIASWARHKGDLYTQVVDFVLTNLEFITSKSALSSDFDSNSFLESMEMLAILLPHYFADLLLKMPPPPECDDQVAEKQSLPSRPPAEFTALLDPSLIIGRKHYESLLNCFDVSFGKSKFDDWDSLQICLNQFLPRLLKITRDLKPGDLDCVDALSQFFRQFCLLFGPVFLDAIVKEQFQTLFMASGGDFHNKISLGDTALTSSAVAVYATGVLTTFDTKERRSELSSFLKEMIQTLSSCFASLDSIKSAFWGIKISNPSYLPLLVEVLWGCVTNASFSIRANAAAIFAIIISEDVDPKVLMTRIFPALITLSTDVNSDVRTASIPALGAIVECSNVSREVVDQVITQMTNFTLPYTNDGGTAEGDRTEPSYHKLNLQLVVTMGQVGPKAHPRFRDEFVLPHLAAIAAGNNQMSNVTKRSDISLELLTAYSNVSCCFIPENLLQSAFLPGLRCLLKDMEALFPEHVAAVNKLIKEKEAKLQRSNSQPVAGQSEKTIARSESKTKFYSKLF